MRPSVGAVIPMNSAKDKVVVLGSEAARLAYEHSEKKFAEQDKQNTEYKG